MSFIRIHVYFKGGYCHWRSFFDWDGYGLVNHCLVLNIGILPCLGIWLMDGRNPARKVDGYIYIYI